MRYTITVKDNKEDKELGSFEANALLLAYAGDDGEYGSSVVGPVPDDIYTCTATAETFVKKIKKENQKWGSRKLNRDFRRTYRNKLKEIRKKEKERNA